MEKNIEGDEYLDYSDETLQRRQNFRVFSLEMLSLLKGPGSDS